MPSPFPGMDPYLEGSQWTSVHTELSTEIARQLAPKLAPKYTARTTQRFVTDMPESVAITHGDMYPDIGVYDTRRQGEVPGSQLMATPSPLEIATVMPSMVPLLTVEIRDVAQRQLVTAIEVLSPTNKRGEGYQEYVDKRSRILNSLSHLVEIDLLRRGIRVPMHSPLPAVPYFVFLSRVQRRPILEVWPIELDAPLPTVPIPLLPGDADVSLDLQQALTQVYDEFRYDLTLDYSQPPEVPLTGKAAQWVVDHLRARGVTVQQE